MVRFTNNTVYVPEAAGFLLAFGGSGFLGAALALLSAFGGSGFLGAVTVLGLLLAFGGSGFLGASLGLAVDLGGSGFAGGVACKRALDPRHTFQTTFLPSLLLALSSF